MGKLLIRLMLIAMAALAVVVAVHSETWTEINRATGAMRTRKTHGWIFARPWVETPTWVSVRAAGLGLKTDSEWQLLTHLHSNLIVTSRGCGLSPVSYYLQGQHSDPDDLSDAERDRFVISFVKGTEADREELIRKHQDSTFAEP